MDLSIEKKNQRKLAAKKRLLTHQSFNNRFVDFNKLLQKNKWFKDCPLGLCSFKLSFSF